MPAEIPGNSPVSRPLAIRSKSANRSSNRYIIRARRRTRARMRPFWGSFLTPKPPPPTRYKGPLRGTLYTPAQRSGLFPTKLKVQLGLLSLTLFCWGLTAQVERLTGRKGREGDTLDAGNLRGLKSALRASSGHSALLGRFREKNEVLICHIRADLPWAKGNDRGELLGLAGSGVLVVWPGVARVVPDGARQVQAGGVQNPRVEERTRRGSDRRRDAGLRLDRSAHCSRHRPGFGNTVAGSSTPPPDPVASLFALDRAVLWT